MALDISKLIHDADFNIVTDALGMIRCGPLRSDDLVKIDQLARSEKIAGTFLAGRLVQIIGRRLTGDERIDAVCGGPQLIDTEIAELTPLELDEFSDQFIRRRLHIKPKDKTTIESPDVIQFSCDQLAAEIIAYSDAQRDQLQSIIGELGIDVLGKTVADSLRRESAADLAGTYGIGESAAELAKKYGIGSSVADLAQKHGFGETISDAVHKHKHGLGVTIGDVVRKHWVENTIGDELRKSTLGHSAIKSALKTIQASNNLGESIASLRASKPGPALDLHAFDQINRTLPPNPIVETNRLLKEQQNYAEEVRPVFIRAAELIQTLTETSLATQALANDNAAHAEAHAQASMKVARRSVYIAIASIVASIIVSSISIYFAMKSPSEEQIEKLATDLGRKADAITENAKLDRAAFEKNVKDDRAAFMEAIANHQESIKQLARATSKAAKSN